MKPPAQHPAAAMNLRPPRSDTADSHLINLTRHSMHRPFGDRPLNRQFFLVSDLFNTRR